MKLRIKTEIVLDAKEAGRMLRLAEQGLNHGAGSSAENIEGDKRLLEAYRLRVRTVQKIAEIVQDNSL